MTLNQLRHRHPRLIYRNFAIRREERNLCVSFNFLLEPDIVFTPEIIIPLDKQRSNLYSLQRLDLYAFHLGLIEAISYWKAACPPQLVVEAGYLSPEQIAWWRHLFIHGLGEFFFRNQIDFTAPGFLTVIARSASDEAIPSGLPRPATGGARNDAKASGDLILVGGGKDSIVTLESLKNFSAGRSTLVLNPWPNALAAVKLAGYPEPILVKRKIDPRLLQLNKQGYLNGHTPFSAYLAFLGVFVAELNGYKNVISSNELSAGEAGLIYKSMEINHQYSKSFAFEKKFRDYCRQYLTKTVQYFSFLRPLYELQIARLFSNLTSSRATAGSVAISGTPRNDVSGGKYDSVFTSCNVGRGKFWCGRCPKCAFSYLSLFPFMSDVRLKKIFGGDLFENPEIQKHILDLVGLGKYKPFDCVGTKDESILAAALAVKKSHKPQKFLLTLEKRLNLTDGVKFRKLHQQIMENWSNQNFLPIEYALKLKQICP